MPEGAKTRQAGGVIVAYEFTAVPETSGSYSVKVDISPNIFTEDSYVVKAQYADYTASKIIAVTDPLDLKEGAIISLDKEVYGLGETVQLSGILPSSGSSSVEISITKPDGARSNSGASVDNQRFSWSWKTPITEKYQIMKTDDGRDVRTSNFGIYKIKVATDTYSKDVFFKVSQDPENDSLSKTPIFVTTEKSLYKAGEKLKVLGNVIKREQGDEGIVVPDLNESQFKYLMELFLTNKFIKHLYILIREANFLVSLSYPQQFLVKDLIP